MDTHYHTWQYVRDEDGIIRSMLRDNHVYNNRRQANYALSDGRQYWKAGQVIKCVDGAFCQPLPQDMAEQLENQAKSIRPAGKNVNAMKLREELNAAGRLKNLEAIKADLAKRQAAIDAEITQILGHTPAQQTDDNPP